MVWPTLGSRTAKEQNGTDCERALSQLITENYIVCTNFAAPPSPATVISCNS